MADNKFDEEAIEDGPPKEAKTIHRMRANSTIMQINKILGELPPLGLVNSPCRADLSAGFTLWTCPVQLANLVSSAQLPTEEKFVSNKSSSRSSLHTLSSHRNALTHAQLFV